MTLPRPLRLPTLLRPLLLLRPPTLPQTPPPPPLRSGQRAKCTSRHSPAALLPQDPRRGAVVNAAAFTNFDDILAILKITKAYGALPADKALFDHIAKNARASNLRDYYIEKLDKLISTETVSAADVSAANATERDASVTEETNRQAAATKADPVKAKTDLTKEETATASKARVWTTMTGGDDATNKPKTYRVDPSDLKNIFVQINVHLRGAAADIAAIEAVEDAIEKFAAVPGYTVDLVFIHVAGAHAATNDQPDVFEVNANTGVWADSVDWGANAQALTHEMHHLLGLDDRYDYIESHADNTEMSIHFRLVWFDVQMVRNKKHGDKKQVDADKDGVDNNVMGKDRNNPPYDSDICAFVQEKNKTACQATRSTLPSTRCAAPRAVVGEPNTSALPGSRATARILAGMVVVMAACGPKSSPLIPPVSGEPPSVAPPPSDAASSGVDAGPPAIPPSAAGSGSGSGSGSDVLVYCFNWVHQMNFSTDCYRSLAACKTERAHAMLGHRDSTPCRRMPTPSARRSRATAPSGASAISTAAYAIVATCAARDSRPATASIRDERVNLPRPRDVEAPLRHHRARPAPDRGHDVVPAPTPEHHGPRVGGEAVEPVGALGRRRRHPYDGLRATVRGRHDGRAGAV